MAVVQAGPCRSIRPACVGKGRALERSETAATGAKVIVFPEAFVPGYPKGVTTVLSSARATPRDRGIRGST